MQGFETLWLPGTDHASIATEVKVVNQLAEQGIKKEEIGREEFFKACLEVEGRVWWPHCKSAKEAGLLPAIGKKNALPWMRGLQPAVKRGVYAAL